MPPLPQPSGGKPIEKRPLLPVAIPQSGESSGEIGSCLSSGRHFAQVLEDLNGFGVSLALFCRQQSFHLIPELGHSPGNPFQMFFTLPRSFTIPPRFLFRGFPQCHLVATLSPPHCRGKQLTNRSGHGNWT